MVILSVTAIHFVIEFLSKLILKYSVSKVKKSKISIFSFYLTVIILHISFICFVQSTTCNSFPKVFGGSSGGTYSFHIDIYNDYLAIAGNTNDKSYTGIHGYIPFLVLASISTGGKYYWAKGLS